MKKIKKVVVIYLAASGVVFNIFVVWMAAGWPIFFDWLLIQSQRPITAAYIVCIAGGLSGNNLPTDDGWQRIYTAVQLYLDGLGKKIIFTGGGAGRVTEAEIYAEMAEWLGCPREAAVFDPWPSRTAEHPLDILKIEGLNISREIPLNVVTSALHSRRTALCFKKHGYSNFRMVTYHWAQKVTDPEKVRHLRTSRFKDFRPSGKSYDHMLNRLRWRISYFFEALREAVAIGWYKIKGYI